MTFQFGTSATSPTAASTATGATTARVTTAAGFCFRGNTTTTTAVTTTATDGGTVDTTSMAGNNNRPRETELKIQTSDDFKRSYVTTCATAFLMDNAVGPAAILPSGTSIQKWIKQPPNKQNMVYVNLMDVNKSRGYINDDSIKPIENWCEIEESDDEYDTDNNIPTVSNRTRTTKRSNNDNNDLIHGILRKVIADPTGVAALLDEAEQQRPSKKIEKEEGHEARRGRQSRSHHHRLDAWWSFGLTYSFTLVWK